MRQAEPMAREEAAQEKCKGVGVAIWEIRPGGTKETVKTTIDSVTMATFLMGRCPM